MDAKKKTILAVSLLLLWAGLAVWQWRLLQEPVRVPLTNIAGHPSVGQRAATGGTGLHVNLHLFTSTSLQRQATFTAPRNIFSIPRPDGTFATGNDPVSVNQPGSSLAETSTEQEEKSELEQYRYLGFLRVGEVRRENKNIAVLKKDDEVLMLKVGDRVDDHLILKAINSESVTIRDTGTHVDQTVSLSEKSSDQSTDQE
ncbi:MAG: hypothetical protein E8D40_00535 [Nitrospira sp.]|jgi:hypothetical protein|nr:MAG: hypothetical protein E8D40_00535 [Nitrospira sp.]